jgi:hypothetical protein
MAYEQAAIAAGKQSSQNLASSAVNG